MGRNERTGGRILVDQLRLHGVDLVFGVPGESYLAALDALYDVPEVRYVVCRQEGGAAMMADAYGKLTNRPGVAFATRGPGASNASVSSLLTVSVWFGICIRRQRTDTAARGSPASRSERPRSNSA